MAKSKSTNTSAFSFNLKLHLPDPAQMCNFGVILRKCQKRGAIPRPRCRVFYSFPPLHTSRGSDSVMVRALDSQSRDPSSNLGRSMPYITFRIFSSHKCRVIRKSAASTQHINKFKTNVSVYFFVIIFKHYNYLELYYQ